MRPYIKYVASTAFLLLCSTANAADLQSELSNLLENHPRLNAEIENVTAAEAAVSEAWSGYLPRVDTTASVGYEETDRTKLVPAGTEFDLDPTSASVTATQNLFEGFRTNSATAAATSEVVQANAALEATRQQLLFEGSSAYIAVLRQVKLTELAKRNMATLRTQLELEDERVERGSGVAVDVLQAKSRLQISKERHTAFVGGLEEAIARYTQVFGTAPDIDVMAPLTVRSELVPASLEVAIEKALAGNPTLKVSDSSIDALDHRRTTAQAGYYPSIDIVASGAYDEDVGGIRGTDVSSSVILRGSWNLFSGFSDMARHKQAVARHQSAIATGQDTKRRVVEEVKLAWANLTTSQERAELLENAVNIAGEVYDARKRLRDVGKDTALNVLDAENELFRAQIDAAAARYNYYTAIYRLLLATGQLQLDSLRIETALPIEAEEDKEETDESPNSDKEILNDEIPDTALTTG